MSNQNSDPISVIETDTQFKDLIDQFGEIQDQINALVSGQKIRKMQLETYANANGVKAAEATKYALKMKRGDMSLICESDCDEKDVISSLKHDQVMREFVVEDWDSKGIKNYVKAMKRADRDEYLAKFGLKLTNPQPKATVSPLG